MASDSNAFLTPEVLATVPRNSREVLRITLERHHSGRSFAKLHVWFRGQDGHLRPGDKLVSIQPERLGEVLTALETARSKLTGGGAR